MVQSIAQLIQIQRLAMNLYFTRGLVKTNDSIGNPQLSLSGQAADPQNLSLADVQINSPDRLARHIHFIIS